MTFRSISVAAVSSNTCTLMSTALLDVYFYNSIDWASAFEGSTSFASIPLQPIPRNSSIHSGPFSISGLNFATAVAIDEFIGEGQKVDAVSGPSLDEKETAYFAARQRIFSEDACDSKLVKVERPKKDPVVARRMITHALGQADKGRKHEFASNETKE